MGKKILVTVILFFGHHKWMLLRFKTIVYHIKCCCRSRKNTFTKMQRCILDSKCDQKFDSISLIKTSTTIMNASTRFRHP